MNEKYKELESYSQKLHAFSAAATLFSWDNTTYGAPKKAINYTAQDMGVLSGEIFSIYNSPEVKALVKELSEDNSLTDEQKAVAHEYSKNIEKIEKIPMDEFMAFNVLLAKAHHVWEKAKLDNDFDYYAPVLEEILSYTKRFCEYTIKPGQTIYENALDDYEEGFKEAMLSDFFQKLKARLLPVVKEKAARTDSEPEFMTIPVSADVQKKLCRFMAEYIGFDFERGVLAETEHPFTTNLHNHDVRITTHYYEDHWTFAMFSTIHEGGHALYEQGIADEITMTPIGGGASLGLHESQSRFYENNLGRGKAFWKPIYEKVANEYLPFLKDVSLDDFYKGINYSRPTLIRTEADELTYPFHVVIRYEMEKMILEGDVKVKDLPKIWNEKYKEYLGIEPKDYTTGILQDMHWAGGNFGYFPTYAIGTAVAAQLYNHMNKKIDIEKLLIDGDMKTIQQYLCENIHKYGKIKNTNQVLTDITGEGFNPDYYTDYLLKKFG